MIIVQWPKVCFDNATHCRWGLRGLSGGSAFIFYCAERLSNLREAVMRTAELVANSNVPRCIPAVPLLGESADVHGGPKACGGCLAGALGEQPFDRDATVIRPTLAAVIYNVRT